MQRLISEMYVRFSLDQIRKSSNCRSHDGISSECGLLTKFSVSCSRNNKENPIAVESNGLDSAWTITFFDEVAPHHPSQATPINKGIGKRKLKKLPARA